jgi:hypothetical protein
LSRQGERARTESLQLGAGHAAATAACHSAAARAYAEGGAEARSNALAALAICAQYGRLDLTAAVAGMTPDEARAFVIDQMWATAFSKARATPGVAAALIGSRT